MRSMTGYSKHIFENELFKILIEIKSVNNKSLNLRIKIPYILNFMENQIKTLVGKYINRGSIDLRIEFEDKSEKQASFTYNEKLATSLLFTLNQMETDLNLKFTDKLDSLIKYGNLIEKSDVDSNEETYVNFILENLVEALEKINQMKSEEGDRLESFFDEKLSLLKNFYNEILVLKDEVVKEYREKLILRLNNIREDVKFKEEDILKEILIFADRSDISEEISRLASHLEALENLINSKSNEIGKKLDFILQEIFRELNTMGVKSNYYPISKLVVEAKSEVEKIREQGMNIE